MSRASFFGALERTNLPPPPQFSTGLATTPGSNGHKGKGLCGPEWGPSLVVLVLNRLILEDRGPAGSETVVGPLFRGFRIISRA